LFGKCNNPAGHGHNYRVNVTVKIADDPFDFLDFERTLKEVIIDHLDHKHLNADVAEFRDLNPSVENIAWVIWHRLKETKWGPDLQNVRVFETPKTWADYFEPAQ
jgi:6-pyruvoyltetrahydropterin/6-carboxytetrahydropterin synthase